MKIHLVKLKEAPNPKHPNNIDEGFEHIGEVRGEYFKKPTVGDGFYAGNAWQTSIVTEILTENTFKTLNSIYEWNVIEK